MRFQDWFIDHINVFVRSFFFCICYSSLFPFQIRYLSAPSIVIWRVLVSFFCISLSCGDIEFYRFREDWNLSTQLLLKIRWKKIKSLIHAWQRHNKWCINGQQLKKFHHKHFSEKKIWWNYWFSEEIVAWVEIINLFYFVADILYV